MAWVLQASLLGLNIEQGTSCKEYGQYGTEMNDTQQGIHTHLDIGRLQRANCLA